MPSQARGLYEMSLLPLPLSIWAFSYIQFHNCAQQRKTHKSLVLAFLRSVSNEVRGKPQMMSNPRIQYRPYFFFPISMPRLDSNFCDECQCIDFEAHVLAVCNLRK